MPQQRFTIVRWTVIAILMVSIGLRCKKKDTITPPPVVTPESLGFKLISAGIFTMGSPTGVGNPDEHPRRNVTLSAFYLDTVELTRKKFLPFLQSKDTGYLATNPDPTKNPRRIESYNTAFPQTDSSPVVNISWYAAVAYCNWLSKKHGLDTCYTFALKGNGTIDTVAFDRTKKGYRLPTEAEWEYACRGGSATEYSFGDDLATLGDYAWYSINSSNITHAVGGKKPNPFGLRDMHGNVWEWVWDWYPAGAPYYPSVAETNPTGPVTVSYRVFRGGSCGNNAFDLRSAVRNVGSPGSRGNSLGFRLAKTM